MNLFDDGNEDLDQKEKKYVSYLIALVFFFVIILSAFMLFQGITE
jgi:hypothetical protein